MLLLFLILIWRFFVIASRAERSVRRPDCLGSYGTYDDSGDLKYSGGDQYHSQHRDHPAFHQLRRNIGGVSPVGNGACIQCVIFGKIEKTNGKGSIYIWEKEEHGGSRTGFMPL